MMDVEIVCIWMISVMKPARSEMLAQVDGASRWCRECCRVTHVASAGGEAMAA